MAPKNEILDSLTELGQEVNDARESLLKGELVTLENVHERIEAQCEKIVGLEPEEAAEVRPLLDELLANLRVFSEEISYVQAKVAEILAEAEKTNDGTGKPES